MNDREELRRLIDVIEKGSGSGSLEQAIDDIKTFANTASFLANKLDTRLKGGEVKAKSKPKSRVGKAIASVPKPNIQKAPSSRSDPLSTNTSGMPKATSIATSQADFERLKPQGSQPPVKAKLIAVVSVAVCAVVCRLELDRAALCGSLRGLVYCAGFKRVIARFLVKEVCLICSLCFL